MMFISSFMVKPCLRITIYFFTSTNGAEITIIIFNPFKNSSKLYLDKSWTNPLNGIPALTEYLNTKNLCLLTVFKCPKNFFNFILPPSNIITFTSPSVNDLISLPKSLLKSTLKRFLTCFLYMHLELIHKRIYES